jgi:hypothetical protein
MNEEIIKQMIITDDYNLLKQDDETVSEYEQKKKFIRDHLQIISIK